MSEVLGAQSGRASQSAHTRASGVERRRAAPGCAAVAVVGVDSAVR
ncbi:hypothetical protein [Streptomyces noursei]|nr:hypothetical protein [Streptomyces noursei]